MKNVVVVIYKGCLLYFLKEKVYYGLLYSGVHGTPRYVPQNPNFDSFFQDFGLFLEIFRKKYHIIGQPGDMVVRKSKIIPLYTVSHRFYMIVVRGVTRNTKKSPKNDLLWVIFMIIVIFWS